MNVEKRSAQSDPDAPKRIHRRRFGALTAGTLTSLFLPPYRLSMARRLARAPDLSDLINPLVGASTSAKLGSGNTFPGATTPFGMVQLSPDTITGGDNAPGYSYDHKTIEGFSFLHMSGVGYYGDFGNLQVMPTTGPMKLARGRIGRPGEGWRSAFSHETEQASANYYAVTLDDYGIRTEVTSAPHAGMLRFTFPRASNARIQIDLARRIAGKSNRQFVKVVDSNSIEGWMECLSSGGGWGNGEGKTSYTVYFRMEFSRPLTNFGVWSIAVPEDKVIPPDTLVTDAFQTDDYYKLVADGKIIPGCAEFEGAHLGFYTEFSTQAGEQVMAKAGISFVSLDGAHKNLLHDIPHWNFDQVHSSGKELWSRALMKIQVESGGQTDQAIFATALYHAMLDPRTVSDVDGNFAAADGTIKQSDRYRRRTIFSGWDVFRTELPLMTIIDPAIVSDQINSLIDLASESGKGYLERWEIMNAYSGCMDGDPALAVITDAYLKGIRTFDVEKAYAACHQTASGAGRDTNRLNNTFYLAHGYVPGSISWTLDNSYFHWCVGKLAEALNKSDDAKMYFGRAMNYKKIYDPAVQSMHARDETGQWIEWKGKTTFGQGCTESNPLQQTWFVPHDVQGLIDLMGTAAFTDSLEDMFEKTPPSFGWNEYYNHGNEPVHHIVYLFVYAGKPWLTQKWVRRILKAAYQNAVNGICGNDDVGQMSAWYVMSALGFYPVCPGDRTYILGSPVFSRATIQLDPQWHKGKTFTVIAINNSADNIYVQSATLNGKPLDRAWIIHDEITAGGVLEFRMGPTPNMEWGISPEHLPPSLSRA